MNATATPDTSNWQGTTKQCTGAKLAGEVLTPAHEAAVSEFNRYKASPDGLDRICRVCWSTYEKTRRARKAAEAAADDQLADAAIELSNAAAERQRSKPPQMLHKFANEDAQRAYHGKLAGYESELIGGVIYALPASPEAVGSHAGQLALATCNEARQQERRRLDRERKREQRARAKAAAAEA